MALGGRKDAGAPASAGRLGCGCLVETRDPDVAFLQAINWEWTETLTSLQLLMAGFQVIDQRLGFTSAAFAASRVWTFLWPQLWEPPEGDWPRVLCRGRKCAWKVVELH